MRSYLCLYLVLVCVLGDGSDCGDAYSQTRLVLANKKTSSTPFKPTLVQRLMSPEEKQCIQKCSSFQACLDLLPQFLRKTHWPITHFGPRLENWTRLGYHTYIYYFLFEMKFEQNHWNHYQSLAFLERNGVRSKTPEKSNHSKDVQLSKPNYPFSIILEATPMFHFYGREEGSYGTSILPASNT